MGGRGLPVRTGETAGDGKGARDWTPLCFTALGDFGDSFALQQLVSRERTPKQCAHILRAGSYLILLTAHILSIAAGRWWPHPYSPAAADWLVIRLIVSCFLLLLPVVGRLSAPHLMPLEIISSGVHPPARTTESLEVCFGLFMSFVHRL